MHQNFLYKCIGTALAACPNKDLVRKQLQELLETARYQEEAEREVRGLEWLPKGWAEGGLWARKGGPCLVSFAFQLALLLSPDAWLSSLPSRAWPPAWGCVPSLTWMRPLPSWRSL